MLFHQRATPEEGAPGREAQSPNRLEETPVAELPSLVQPHFGYTPRYYRCPFFCLKDTYS